MTRKKRKTKWTPARLERLARDIQFIYREGLAMITELPPQFQQTILALPDIADAVVKLGRSELVKRGKL